MSRYLYVTKIEVVSEQFVLTEDNCSAVVDRDTVIAEADDGYYVYCPPFARNASAPWPAPQYGKIQLFRDYWRFLCEKNLVDHKLSLRDKAYCLAPKKVVADVSK